MATETNNDTKQEPVRIIINLNEDRDAYEVPTPDDMIHLNERDQIKNLLNESITEAKKYAANPDKFVRKHDTIMLAGVRGSGKTTFMLSLLNFIREDAKSLGLNDEKGIEVLNIFDPTLIEDKVHVFINIISLIKDRVDEKAKKSNCFKDPDCDDGRSYKEWEKSFKKLADGLPAINGVGHDGFSGDEWLDSEFIMNKGVGRAHAANYLERNFHDFVRKSLKFIGRTAFLLCFDDIDTNFGKGWPVLEVLHKYLTSPQFITILSGDPNLYLILIRDQQWKNFSNKLLKMESDDIQRQKETVAHLEEQYFLKMLKPEHRIFLDSLYRKEQQNSDYPIFVKGSVLNDSLFGCYRLLMKSFGVFSGGQQYTCYRFLASTPLRTQKQLLCAFDDSLQPESNSDLGSKIIEIYWSDLAEKKVNVSNLRNVPHYAIPQIVDYLVKNKLLIEGHTLSPVFSDHFINGAQFALGTLMTDRIKKDPSMIFEFWLKVCLSRELGAIIEEGVNSKENGPSIEDFVDYCAVNKLRTPRYVARFATAYLRAYLGYQAGTKSSEMRVSYAKGSWHGTLPLYGLAYKKKLTDRIDYVLDKENKNYFLKIMGYLPLSGATNHRGESLPVYSLYNLLGVLGEIVLAARSAKEEDAVREVRRTIVKNSQFREYPLPGWAQVLSSDGDQAIENIDEDNITDNEIERVSKEFASAMVEWARNIDTKFVVSPSIMAKAFTRFFYSSNNMDKELSQSKNLGYWMHRMVIVFLNSVLVVEAMETINLTNAKLDLRNPVEKDDIFISNLKKVNAYDGEDTKRLKLSKWILSCPIWKIYLKDSFEFSPNFSDPDSSFSKFIYEQEVYEEWSGLNDLLEQVQIRNTDYGVNVLTNKKASRKKNKSRLPGFSVNDDKSRTILANVFKSKDYQPSNLMTYKPEELKELLRKELGNIFNSNSINVATAKSIIDRINNGTFTW
ncbi:MAG: hypothetical protein WCK54_18955 [Desulfuromonadales bacterium]